MTLIRWLTFLLGSLTVTFSPALLDSFLSSNVGICSTMAFLPLGNSNHVVVSVSINFLPNSKRDAPLHRIAYDYYHADWNGFHDHLRDVPWENIFKLGASAAASEFCERVRINLYIPHHKYQVNPHSSLWFSTACAAAIVHRNHFLRLLQQSKSSESKVKFRQASNCCERVLEAENLHMLIKQRSPSLPRNLTLEIFGELLIVFSTKVNMLYLCYATAWSCCLLHLIQHDCLMTLILTLNSNLDDSGICLPVFPPRTNLKLPNISVTLKMVNKVITNLDSSKASGPDCIPVVVLKNCEPELSYMLSELFNMCLKESCFPGCWKVSSVVPVFKNVGQRSTAKNYCPVSLFSVVSKVFEKLVNRTVDHLEKCGLFSDFQHGFKSSQSTADLLIVVSDRIAKAFNRSGGTPTVAIDISKAFDRVWHAGFLHKLN